MRPMPLDLCPVQHTALDIGPRRDDAGNEKLCGATTALANS